MTARAVVAFGDADGLWWLKLLRPGFRHCFVAIETDAGWVVIDPLSDRTVVRVVAPSSAADLAEWYGAHNYSTVELAVDVRNGIAMPWRPYSCVEEVKRVLGIRAGFILTPWQLHKHISRKRNKDLARHCYLVYIQQRASRACAVFAALISRAAEFLRRRKEQNMINLPQEVPMGGFLGGAPEPPVPMPLPTAADPEAEARKTRLDTIARNRRGRAGMVAGDERGVLAPVTGQGKSLLGE